MNYEARLRYYEDDISSNSQAGQQNTATRCYGYHGTRFQKNVISPASSLYTVVFTQCKPSFSQPLSFPTVFGDFQAAFLQEHLSIIRNMKYTEIRRNVKTLRFLEKLRSASAMLFAPQLRNQATHYFHFFLPHNNTSIYQFPVLS